jgi:cytochrome c-type biogenesis protein
VGWFTALWGGFSSFFSIWQVCILQISPFFLAYLVGIRLIDDRKRGEWQELLSCAAYAIGFSVIYALLSSRGIDAGRVLLSHINGLRIAAGVVIGLISLHLIFGHSLSINGRLLRSIVYGGCALLLGLSFAVIYSPCVTPTYAKILQIGIDPQTAKQGAFLAWIYGLGMALSFSFVGMLLVLSLRYLSEKYRSVLRNICGAFLGVLALMNITGVMVYYKAFFLGFLV